MTQQQSEPEDIGLDRLLPKWLDKWQGRMKLKDWDIHLFIVPLNDLPEDCDAEINFDPCHAKASIAILDPAHAELSRSRLHDYDPEYSLVHELVHLRLADINKEDGSIGDAIMEERAVNAFTNALMEMDATICALEEELAERTAQQKPSKKSK